MHVTVIYTERTRTTTLHRADQAHETSPEPDGLAGAWRTAELLARTGHDVAVEIR